MKYRSGLSKARGVGSAKSGVEHWMKLRFAAIAMIFLVVWLGFFLLGLKGADYETAVAWVTKPLNTLMLVFFVFTAFYHSALGIQEVIEDYVHKRVMKKFFLHGTKLLAFFLGGAAIFSVLSLYFKG